MKTTVAFSVLAAVSMVAIPVSASADCVGYHQSKVVSTSQSMPVAAAPVAEPVTSQTAQVETSAASSAPSNLVADLAVAGTTPKSKAE
jgi:hypothetical protein